MTFVFDIDTHTAEQLEAQAALLSEDSPERAKLLSDAAKCRAMAEPFKAENAAREAQMKQGERSLTERDFIEQIYAHALKVERVEGLPVRIAPADRAAFLTRNAEVINMCEYARDVLATTEAERSALAVAISSLEKLRSLAQSSDSGSN